MVYRLVSIHSAVNPSHDKLQKQWGMIFYLEDEAAFSFRLLRGLQEMYRNISS